MYTISTLTLYDTLRKQCTHILHSNIYNMYYTHSIHYFCILYTSTALYTTLY